MHARGGEGGDGYSVEKKERNRTNRLERRGEGLVPFPFCDEQKISFKN